MSNPAALSLPVPGNAGADAVAQYTPPVIIRDEVVRESVPASNSDFASKLGDDESKRVPLSIGDEGYDGPGQPRGRHSDHQETTQRTSSRPRDPVIYNLKELKLRTMPQYSPPIEAEVRGVKRRRTMNEFPIADAGEMPVPQSQVLGSSSNATQPSSLRNNLVTQGVGGHSAQGNAHIDLAQTHPASGMVDRGVESEAGRQNAIQQLNAVGKLPHVNAQPAGIMFATAGRSYHMYRDVKGNLAPTYGACIPEGWTFTSIPDHPCICPIRSCRCLYKDIVSLGNHFVGSHQKCLLNDNGDGTLSITHTYGQPGQKFCPAIVVSRRPLDPTEPPMLQPALREGVPWKNMAIHSQRDPPESTQLPPETAASQLASAEPLPPQAQQMWNSITPFLKKFKNGPPNSQVRDLLFLPKQRDLQWNPQMAVDTFIDVTPKDVTSLLVQMTGDASPTPCGRCQEGKGPFVGCYIMTSTTRIGTVLACANCCYKGRQTACSLKPWLHERKVEEERGHRDRSRPVGRPAGRHSRLSGIGLPNDTPEQALRPPVPSQVTPQSTVEMRPDPDPVKEDFVKPPGRRTMLDALRQSGALNMLYRERPEKSPENSHNASSIQDKPQDKPILVEDERETWEVAPGRIRSETGDPLENIAMSKDFLTAGYETQVCDEAFFKIEVIPPGRTHHFETNSDRIRLCSIATGKLRIRIEAQTPFLMGSQGIFKIKPSQKCSVEVVSSTEAIVHITSIVVQ